MNTKHGESIPKALALRDALERSAPLARLRERLDDSNRRFAAIRHLLPDAWLADVRPGPADDAGWTLLAGNPAVAAKLRQLQPHIEQALRDRGWQVSATRVRVQRPAPR